MNLQKNEFATIESRKSKSITLIAKSVRIAIFVITVFGTIDLIIGVLLSEKFSLEIKILSVIFSLGLIAFLIYICLLQLNDERKNKINKVIVNQIGLHHYQDETIIKTITFESLRPNPNQKKYDIDLSDGDDVDVNLCVHYFDNSQNKTIYKGVTIETPFSVQNGKELIRHFIVGIINFRTDLKISPGVFDFFKLKKQ